MTERGHFEAGIWIDDPFAAIMEAFEAMSEAIRKAFEPIRAWMDLLINHVIAYVVDRDNYPGTFHKGAWRPRRDRFSRWILWHWAPKEKEVG